MLSTVAALVLAHAPLGTVTKAPFGTAPDGSPVFAFTLTNAKGASAKVITWGATLVQLKMPDKDGNLGDVALGLDSLEPYEGTVPYFGATVGRYANRIAKGQFTLGGKTYQVPVNNGPNSLHGGTKGYDKRLWKATQLKTPDGPAVTFLLTDKAGEQGYPGTVNVSVTYVLTNDNALRLRYHATTTKPTPFNITNHSYWNLKDAGKSDVKDHVLKLDATRYTPVDDTLIPTGEIKPVAGTPYDFTQAKPLGQDLDRVDNGYDVNFVVEGTGLRRAAMASEPTTGRTMEVWTDQPGIQLYTGGFLDGTIIGRNDAKYDRFHAFCLETQHYPDSPNQPSFPSAILVPKHPFESTTEYRFGVMK